MNLFYMYYFANYVLEYFAHVIVLGDWTEKAFFEHVYETCPTNAKFPMDLALHIYVKRMISNGFFDRMLDIMGMKSEL